MLLRREAVRRIGAGRYQDGNKPAPSTHAWQWACMSFIVCVFLCFFPSVRRIGAGEDTLRAIEARVSYASATAEAAR